MINDNILPIGSIVNLKKQFRKTLIIGYDLKKESNTYEYVGCIYPEGYTKKEDLLLFNIDDIESIYYIGYQNALFKDYLLKRGNV